MESLVIQEQNKNSSVFYTEDSSSESNTSEMSRHRDEDSCYSRQQNTRSRTPEPRKEKHTTEFTSSPQTSPRMLKPVTHAQSVPQLEMQDRRHRTPSRDPEKSSSSRVSYEGSSFVEYQVRYVGGYRSGPEDESEEPVRLMPYDRSPARHRKGSEPLDNVDTRRTENSQLMSSVTEHSVASTQPPHKSRDERADEPLNLSRSPSSSPYLRRKVSDTQINANFVQFAGSTPVSTQKQKKTAIVSPLLEMSDSRPRSVPPGLLMFDPTDPESERVEQVSRVCFIPIFWSSFQLCIKFSLLLWDKLLHPLIGYAKLELVFRQ